ncbi:MAG: damage-inducible protein, partial [Polyangiaceae bacterium]|nr:damage-inducible protein [Polyangiaceae bacterium]
MVKPGGKNSSAVSRVSAADVARIAERWIGGISQLVAQPGDAKLEFDRFMAILRERVSPYVTSGEVVEMLALHTITMPIYDSLFGDYSFAENHVLSQSMRGIVGVIKEQLQGHYADDLESLRAFCRPAGGAVDCSESRQKSIVEVYDRIIRAAFPKVAGQLGVVYTPVEIVDFIIRSVEEVLRREFEKSISDESVHILDPFAGTGVFIARLLQSNLIADNDIARKYLREIHANEIMLIAYYVASINIESAYHEQCYPTTGCYPHFAGENSPNDTTSLAFRSTRYTPFRGIRLTDTFSTRQDVKDEPATNGHGRLRIIIGNPPYSIGQRSANDKARNQSYAQLEERIRATYVAQSEANLSKAAYDAYVKAFRWASDCLDADEGGIIGFVSNSSWLNVKGLDGFRKSIEQEFSSIYVLNLRGAIRGRGRDAVKREGQNVFDIMTGVAVTVLVKNPRKQNGKSVIYYHDVGNYLNRAQKLGAVREFRKIDDVPWTILRPNARGDWIDQRTS